MQKNKENIFKIIIERKDNTHIISFYVGRVLKNEKKKQSIQQVYAFNGAFICSRQCIKSCLVRLCKLTVLSLYCMGSHKLAKAVAIKRYCV